MAEDLPDFRSIDLLRTDEGKVAVITIYCTVVERRTPGYLGSRSDGLAKRFLQHFDASARLHLFGSDFLGELLGVLELPVIAVEIQGERTRKQALVRSLYALRRLQGGDASGAIAALQLPDAEAAASRAALAAAVTRALESHHSITSQMLEFAAEHVLREAAPAAAKALRELARLLEEDPTATSGPEVTILLHLGSPEGIDHPGYCVVGKASLQEDVLPSNVQTNYAVNLQIRDMDSAFDASLSTALDGAKSTCRALDRPRIDRGLHLSLRLSGLEERWLGKSAGLPVGLLFLACGRSAWWWRRREPAPRTSGTGVVHADGSVHEVETAALPVKLRRVRESAIRDFYLAEEQRDLTLRTWSELDAEYAGGTDSHTGLRAGTATLTEEVVPFPSPPPVDDGVGLRPATELHFVRNLRDLEPEFISNPRPVGEWIHRLWRRNPLQAAIVATTIVLLLAFIAYLVLPRFVRQARFADGRVHVQFQMPPQSSWTAPSVYDIRGSIIVRADSFAVRTELDRPRVFDLDGDGHVEIVSTTIDTQNPGEELGSVRIDLLQHRGWRLRHRWTRYVTRPLHYVGEVAPLGDRFNPQQVSFEDWNADGQREIFVATKNIGRGSILSVLDIEGRLLLEYVNAGHIWQSTLVPRVFGAPRQGTRSFEHRTPESEFGIALSCQIEELSCAGLVHLPPGSRSGRLPAEQPKYTYDGYEEVAGMTAVAMPRTLGADLVGHTQNWAREVKVVSEGSEPLVEVSVIELLPNGVLIRVFDRHLQLVDVQRTTAYVNLLRELELRLERPLLDDPALLRSERHTVLVKTHTPRHSP